MHALALHALLALRFCLVIVAPVLVMLGSLSCQPRGSGPSSTPAARTNPPAEPSATAAAAEEERWLEQALQENPDDGVFMLELALRAAARNDRARALSFLDRLDRTGWAIPLPDYAFASLRDSAEYKAVASRIAERTPRVERSTAVLRLQQPDLFPEGIAVDPRSKTFYLSSLTRRLILSIDINGVTKPFVTEAQDGLMSTLGMRVDTKRNLLWVASAALPSMNGLTKEQEGRAGLFAFELGTGRLHTRVLLDNQPTPHLLNDVAIASNGTVYVTDSLGGTVYALEPGKDTLEPLLEPGTLVYPNGIDIDALTDRLYVAHTFGIDILNLATSTMKPLEHPGNIPTAGMDGLYVAGQGLVGIQNGLGKPRVVRLDLASSMDRVEHLEVLENAHPALGVPTTGAILQNGLFFIGDSNLDELLAGKRTVPGELVLLQTLVR